MSGILDESDERNVAIRNERQKAFEKRQGVRVGDFVRFSCGLLRRVSYVWDFADGGVQTSGLSDGSYYLAGDYCSFSGGLFPSVPPSSLTLTDETREGSVWFFRNDWSQAHNGIDTTITFRVFECSLPANR